MSKKLICTVFLLILSVVFASAATSCTSEKQTKTKKNRPPISVKGTNSTDSTNTENANTNQNKNTGDNKQSAQSGQQSQPSSPTRSNTSSDSGKAAETNP